MTGALTPTGPDQARYLAYLKKLEPSKPRAIPVLFGEDSGVASTYIVARNAGGVGASMLVLMLAYLLQKQPLIIQVGGLQSWAYGHLGQEDFCHIKPHENADRFSPPLDRRLEQSTRVAIIEYEQAMPGEAIKAVNLLTDRFGAHGVLCLVAAAQDDAFRLADTAQEHGVTRLLRFREHGLAPEPRSDVIRIPTVPLKVAKHLRTAPGDFSDYASGWLGPVAAMTFYDGLHSMGAQILEQLR